MSYSCPCRDNIPGKGNLREEELIVAQTSRIQSITTGKAGQGRTAEREAAHPSATAVRKQREMTAGVQLRLRTPVLGMVLQISRAGPLPQFI